jgi:hypothetical protein
MGQELPKDCSPEIIFNKIAEKFEANVRIKKTRPNNYDLHETHLIQGLPVIPENELWRARRDTEIARRTIVVSKRKKRERLTNKELQDRENDFASLFFLYSLFETHNKIVMQLWDGDMSEKFNARKKRQLLSILTRGVLVCHETEKKEILREFHIALRPSSTASSKTEKFDDRNLSDLSDCSDPDFSDSDEDSDEDSD